MAGAIAGVAVTATRATPVAPAAERLQGLQQQAMGGSTIQTGPEKPTPAGVLSPATAAGAGAVRNGGQRGREGMRHGPEHLQETSGSPD